MNKLIGIIGILLLSFNSLNAQICYDELKLEDNIKVKYKWKENKEGAKELRIKFKTTAKSDLNTDLEGDCKTPIELGIPGCCPHSLQPCLRRSSSPGIGALQVYGT